MALGALHLILNDLGFCRDFCHCELLREGRLKVSDRSVTRPRSVHGLMTCLSVKFGKYTEITISALPRLRVPRDSSPIVSDSVR